MIYLLSINHIFGQSESKKIDSLRLSLLKKIPDSTRANILYKLANPYTVQSSVDSALFYADILLKFSENLNDSTFWKARAIKLIGDSYIKKKDYEQSIYQHNQALEAIQKLTTDESKKLRQAIEINILIGYYLWKKYDEAIKKGLPLLKYIERGESTKRNEEFIFRYLGNAYLGLNNTERATEYYKKAIAVPIEDRELKITLSVANINALYNAKDYVNALELVLPVIDTIQKEKIENRDALKAYKVLCGVYEMKGEYGKTIQYYDKMIKIAEKKNEHGYAILALKYKATALKKINKPKESLDTGLLCLEVAKKYDFKQLFYSLNNAVGYQYIDLKDYANAAVYLKEALLASEKGENSIDIANSHTSLGEAYLKLEKFQEAGNSFEKGKKIFLSNKDLPMSLPKLCLYHESLSIIYSFQGEHKNSLLHYKKYIKYKDSLAMNDQKGRIAELDMAYETEKKNKEIEVLSAQNEVQKLKADKEKDIRIGLLLVGIVSFLFLGIVYNRYRIEKNAVATIERQKIAIEKKSIENELLVKEIHHRVKNNLQIILSLLGSYIPKGDEKIKRVILESKNRIKSMALIHQNLHNTESFTKVPTASYFDDLIRHIKNSYNDMNKLIRFTTDIENSEIKMTLAVPLGLIVNELITNTYKYAFTPHQGEHIVTVFFRNLEGEKGYHLKVSDNGKGLPDDFNIEASESFGLQMVKGMVSQLRGKMEYYNEAGAHFNIYIKEAVL